jgi:hypothetical protein
VAFGDFEGFVFLRGANGFGFLLAFVEERGFVLRRLSFS